jgi:hypothetical protein
MVQSPNRVCVVSNGNQWNEYGENIMFCCFEYDPKGKQSVLYLVLFIVLTNKYVTCILFWTWFVISIFNFKYNQRIGTFVFVSIVIAFSDCGKITRILHSPISSNRRNAWNSWCRTKSDFCVRVPNRMWWRLVCGVLASCFLLVVCVVFASS